LLILIAPVIAYLAGWLLDPLLTRLALRHELQGPILFGMVGAAIVGGKWLPILLPLTPRIEDLIAGPWVLVAVVGTYRFIKRLDATQLPASERPLLESGPKA